MDRDLLRLALVNHAIAHHLSYTEAWPLVDELLASTDEGDVRVLADKVREAATDSAFGLFTPPTGRQ